MTNYRRGAFWMVLAGISFTAMLVCVRYLNGRYPSIEVVFFQNFVELTDVFSIAQIMKVALAAFQGAVYKNSVPGVAHHQRQPLSMNR